MSSRQRLFLLLELFIIISISSSQLSSEEWNTTEETLTTEESMSTNSIEAVTFLPREDATNAELTSTENYEITESSSSLLTTDYATTTQQEVVTIQNMEDKLITAVKSKKEMSDEITIATSVINLVPSVTPPSIDSKEFLSEIAKTTVSESKGTTAASGSKNHGRDTDETDPANLPNCEDLIVDNSREDDGVSDSSFTFGDEGIMSREVGEVSDDGGSPIITGSTESSLTVSWTAPSKNITVLFYVVEWLRSSTSVGICKSSNETFNHTISGLQACTSYDVHLTTYIKDAKEQKRVISETTRLIVEKTSLNLQVSGKGASWLRITWSVPNNDCVDKYVVDYCDKTNCSTADVNQTAFNATELTPCTKYNLTVSVHGKGSVYGATNVNADTSFLLPGKPTPAWTEAGKNSLKIHWTSPIGASCVSHYRITVARGNEPVDIRNSSGNQIKINSLQSCKDYEVTIVPVHKTGDSEPEIFQSNRTFPSVLNPPNMHPMSPGASNNSIKIKWLVYTNEDNNCEDTKLITYCNYTKILGHGYNGVNGRVEAIIEKGGTRDSVEILINDMSPFTRYNCYSYAVNSQGKSEDSLVVEVITNEDVPSAPELTASDNADTQFVLNWKSPVYLPGNLTTFEIRLICYPNFTSPLWCSQSPEVTDTIRDIEGNLLTFVYKNAIPYSGYRAKIRAKTNKGWGNFSENVSIQTLPGAPGPVSNLSYSIEPDEKDPNNLHFFLYWGTPCFIHGEKMERYYIEVVGERKNFEPHVFSEIVDFTNGRRCINDSCLTDLTLRPEYDYTFEIQGKVKGYSGLGEKNSITAMFPAGIPPLPETNYTDQIRIDPYKARRTTTTATILLPVFPDTYGQIHCYAVIVAKSGYNHGNFSRIDLLNNEWPDIASWIESMSVDFELPYQAVKFCDHINPSYIVDYGRLRAVKFVLGDDTETCPELSVDRNQRSYCNGPLKPDTWYDVRMRAFTNGGYRDSMIFTIKTKAEMRIAIVIGTIFGILFLGIMTTMMLLVRKCSPQAVLRRFLNSDMPGSPVPTPFTRRKFIAHCQQLADNPGKLSNEFQLLQTLSVDLQMPTNAACLQANRKKNRYTDILPYDFSRVKLEAMDSDPNSDYINASFIKGCSGDEEYIACQGPKEETTYDFWRMIDQYDVKLIVMLTQLIEKNKEKCHQYYPTARETFTYENMTIRCSRELDYRTYTQRTLILQKENEKRTITHLHFKDWPDHDVPEDFDPMINFCQIMRRHIAANPGLAVVHCSAGIGRTGTLIAIDILLQHIKENRKLDVFGTVYRLRHHRINMVQRESQYAYIYNCIRQVLKNPYFSKSYKPPSVDPLTDNNANNKKKDTSITNLVSSLETLKKSSLSTSVESADQIFNSSSSTSSSPKSTNCLSLHGLRYSKSTSAICSKPYRSQIVRYNTLDYPVYEIEREGKSSTSSLDDSEDSTSSFYENLEPLKKSKSTNSVSEDSTVTEKLLDTSL